MSFFFLGNLFNRPWGDGALKILFYSVALKASSKVFTAEILAE